MKVKYRKIIWVVSVLILILLVPIAYFSSSESIDITIRDKERITTGVGENISSKFIIYTEGEVFENTDSFIFFKFNSADFQNTLEVGKTYEVEVAGWRIPVLSYYRNITKIKIVHDE